MPTSYEKLMRLLGKSLGLEALQPKGSLQNHKQTSASIQRRVEAQDTDNINLFTLFYTLQRYFFSTHNPNTAKDLTSLSLKRSTFPYPLRKTKQHTARLTRKVPTSSRSVHRGRDRIVPHKKQNSDNIQLLMLSLF